MNNKTNEAKMQALVKYKEGKGNLEIRYIEKPAPGPKEVLIKVKAAGVCGSDLHIYDGDIQIPMQFPVAIGHEFSGKIEEIGEEVTEFNPGERVTAETAFSTCLSCEYCKLGDYNLCQERKGLGFWVNGAFAEYVVVPAKRIHKLPKEVSYQAGALMEPFACAYNGTNLKVDINPGDEVLLSGPGTIGLLALQIAVAAGGIVTVTGTDEDQERLEMADQLGAKQVIKVGEGETQKKLKSIFGKQRFDVVLECSGSPAAARLGIDLIKKGGQFSQIGLFGHPIEIDFEKIAYKELFVTGSFSQKWQAWNEALKLLKLGLVDLESLATHIYDLNEWEEAFNKFSKFDSIKVLLKT